jgi:hypothetical protein
MWQQSSSNLFNSGDSRMYPIARDLDYAVALSDVGRLCIYYPFPDRISRFSRTTFLHTPTSTGKFIADDY